MRLKVEARIQRAAHRTRNAKVDAIVSAGENAATSKELSGWPAVPIAICAIRESAAGMDRRSSPAAVAHLALIGRHSSRVVRTRSPVSSSHSRSFTTSRIRTSTSSIATSLSLCTSSSGYSEPSIPGRSTRSLVACGVSLKGARRRASISASFALKVGDLLLKFILARISSTPRSCAHTHWRLH